MKLLSRLKAYLSGSPVESAPPADSIHSLKDKETVPAEGRKEPGRKEISAKDSKEGKEKIKEEEHKVGKPEGEKDREIHQEKDLNLLFKYVIKPEERTLRNYINPKFWKDKRELYRTTREKEKQDINVYQVLTDGARPTVEYYILTVLSCIIATTGLIQGSTATIIGAMIVAPLMTPILSFSLGIIWGDTSVIKTALKSLLKGIALTVIISAGISFAIPMPDYSAEIVSRTHPTIFDIIVALASGIVGAYGYANKRISATLVGIAIAVALMPPLCTVGIGFGTMNLAIAQGATILFVINLVSISLAGAVIFWIMKIHPVLEEEARVRKRALYQIVVSIVILIAIAIPIGYYMWEGYLVSKIKTIAAETIRKKLPGISIMQMARENLPGRLILDITITGERMPENGETLALIEEINNKSGGGEVRLRFIKSSSFRQ